MMPTNGLQVLIVDDDDADSMIIEQALETAPVPPVTSRVSDGQQALDYLRRRPPYREAVRPDLILLDLNMPRVSGHEVLAQLKADPDLCTIPIVVLSTSDDATDILTSYTQHANAYVTKPFDLESFEQVVHLINRFYADVARRPSRRE
jgi:CheY-like chemotaxis protein